MIWLTLACHRTEPTDGVPTTEEPALVRSWPDADGDGFGDEAAPRESEEVPAGHVTVGGDCDDADPARHPGATEVCGRIDEDCDGLVDDDDPDVVPGDQGRLFGRDEDGDDYAAGDFVSRCRIADGWSPQGGDCDDADPWRHPYAQELCDGLDDDCDGLVDDDDPDLQPWANGNYGWDDDGDGDGGEPVLSCDVPASGVAPDLDDCDDTDPALSGADLDGDGWSSCGECDDDDPDHHPGAVEVCDGVDGDCDLFADLVTLPSPAGCDLCALDEPDPARIEVFTLNPCLLDPAVTHLCQPGLDTHTSGRSLHRVIRRTDLPQRRDRLLVWLGDDAADTRLLELAAWNGWTVLALGIDTSIDAMVVCAGQAANCAGDVRGELSDGVDRTSQIDVGPADSVEGRLETALRALVTADPGQGWASWLVAGGGVRWSEVVAAGFREGAGAAAWLGQQHALAGELLVSGPQDRGPGLQISPWLAPGATPSCAQWAVYNLFEASVQALYQQPLLTLGVPSETTLPLDPDIWPPPPEDHLFVITTLAHDAPPSCTASDATVVDGCADLDETWLGWSAMWCLVGAPPDCP